MNPRIFDSAVSLIQAYYEQRYSQAKSKEIIAELWSYPVDVVFAKHHTAETLIQKFYQKIEEFNFRELAIKPFKDYGEIQKLDEQKVLVTTGLKELQYAKIKALGIENDFEEIFIDDPRTVPRRHKIDIFRQILLETKIECQEFWVIGDNPESEIQAGKALGMKTIQRKSKGQKLSELADYKIESFKELEKIIK